MAISATVADRTVPIKEESCDFTEAENDFHKLMESYDIYYKFVKAMDALDIACMFRNIEALTGEYLDSEYWFPQFLERELAVKYRELISVSFAAMSAGLISIQEYLDILLIYPDDFSRRRIIRIPK